LKREKRQRHHQTRTSKQYSSQHELPVVHYSKKAHQQRTLREVSFVVVVVVIISQERRRRKKVNDRERENERIFAHASTCEKNQNQKTKRTSLHASLADVDGNNLSHY